MHKIKWIWHYSHLFPRQTKRSRSKNNTFDDRTMGNLNIWKTVLICSNCRINEKFKGRDQSCGKISPNATLLIFWFPYTEKRTLNWLHQTEFSSKNRDWQWHWNLLERVYNKKSEQTSLLRRIKDILQAMGYWVPRSRKLEYLNDRIEVFDDVLEILITGLRSEVFNNG